MIGDKILLERFRSLFDEGTAYYNQTPFGPMVLQGIETLLNAVNFGDEEGLYRYTGVYQEIWINAIRDSIIALRMRDLREQREEGDIPSAFGVDELMTYFKDYTNFESVLYGSTRFYRDHVLHVVRVWLLGIYSDR